MDNCSSTGHFVVAGVGERLYDGFFYSYPVGCCHYHCARQGHSGEEARLKDVLMMERMGMKTQRGVRYEGEISHRKTQP